MSTLRAESSRARAVRALTDRLRAIAGSEALDDKGYARDVAANLVGPLPATVERAFKSGAGNELSGKMRAPHSSSALAVSSFLPWATDPSGLALAGVRQFTSLAFEQPCSTGLPRIPPHLDVICDTGTHVVAVESKCLEYFTGKEGTFAEAYSSINDTRSHTRWFSHVCSGTNAYRHLDVPQLVKHYLGLAYTYPARPIVLLYLYWEPDNWRDIPECVDHREELQRFAYSVAGDDVRFASLSYPELWANWVMNDASPDLATHVATLRSRYAARI